MQSPETRPSLLANLRDSSDQAAWSEFSSLYRPLIYRVARAKGLQHADAEDLCQEVLTAVGRSIGSFERRGEGSFRRWLFQVTRNLVVNHLTRRGRPIGSGDSNVRELLAQQQADDETTAPMFLLEYRRARFQQTAARLKSQFSLKTWNAFWLTAVEEQSIESVADQLKKSPGAVRVARCRVLAKLRQAVRDQDDSEILLPCD